MATETDVELVVEALRARATQRQRASTQLAQELDQRRSGGTDVRSGALKVVDELARAQRLNTIADKLADGTKGLVDSRTVTLATEPIPPIPPVTAVESEDDTDPIGDTVFVDGMEVDILPDHQVDEADEADLAVVDALLDGAADD